MRRLVLTLVLLGLTVPVVADTQRGVVRLRTRPPVQQQVESGEAHLWVDTDGGTCTRNSSPAAYVDAAACSSFGTATSAASTGDTIRIKTGTYGPQGSIGDGTKVLTFIAEDATVVDTGDTCASYDHLNFAGKVTLDNVDVEGDYPLVLFEGADNTWKNCRLAQGREIRGNCDAPVLIQEAVSDDPEDTITNTTLEDCVFEGQRAETGVHLEIFRIGANVDGVVIQRNVFEACPDGTGFVGCGSGHIFITTPNPSKPDPTNLVIRNNIFHGTTGKNIGVQINVSLANSTVAYNTFKSNPIELNANPTSLLMAGNAGARIQTCTTGVTWTANVWQWSVGTPCGTDTRVTGTNFAIDQLGLNATTLRPESGAAVIDAAEATCASTANAEDLDSATRPEGDGCDAGAVEFGASGGFDDAASAQHGESELGQRVAKERRAANFQRVGHARMVRNGLPALIGHRAAKGVRVVPVERVQQPHRALGHHGMQRGEVADVRLGRVLAVVEDGIDARGGMRAPPVGRVRDRRDRRHVGHGDWRTHDHQMGRAEGFDHDGQQTLGCGGGVGQGVHDGQYAQVARARVRFEDLRFVARGEEAAQGRAEHGLKGPVNVPGAGIVRDLLERDAGAGQSQVRVRAREFRADQARRVSEQRTEQPLSQAWRRVTDRREQRLVGDVRRHVPTELAERRVIRVIEAHDPADAEQLVHVEEIDQRVVERVHPVDEREVHRDAFGQQRGQGDMRGLLAEVNERSVSGAVQVVQADAVEPVRAERDVRHGAAALERVDDDVPRGRGLRQRLADVERGDAVREADFEAPCGTDRPDQRLQVGAFVFADGILHGDGIAGGREREAGVQQVGEDGIHGGRRYTSQIAEVNEIRHGYRKSPVRQTAGEAA